MRDTDSDVIPSLGLHTRASLTELATLMQAATFAENVISLPTRRSRFSRLAAGETATILVFPERGTAVTAGYRREGK